MPTKKQAHPSPFSPEALPTPPAPCELAADYEARVRTGGLKDDPQQRRVIAHLQSLLDALQKNKGRKRKNTLSAFFLRQEDMPMGMYIWGDVGRGKSMLMELFFTRVDEKMKRRVHFHAFMQEVHARLRLLRKEGKGDPLALLAQEIAQENRVLCFDELQATDVADATLLQRLFQALFSQGVVIVSTSNRPPEALYTGGVQGERFAGFIALIRAKMQIISLNSPDDYRRAQQTSQHSVYAIAQGETAETFINEWIARLGAATQAHTDYFVVHGRQLPFVAHGQTTGRFSFAQLCEQPLGAADYLAIAKRLQTVILTDVPRLTPEQRNEAKRLVLLVDALYEHKTLLICTASAPADALYLAGDGSFEFSRTVSRLIEMQSVSWLSEHRTL